METNVSGGNSDDANKNEAGELRKTEALVQTDTIVTDQLLGDIRILIEKRRQRIAQAINTELVMLYWHIGKRIRSEIIGDARAEYGERVVGSTQMNIALRSLTHPNAHLTISVNAIVLLKLYLPSSDYRITQRCMQYSRGTTMLCPYCIAK